MLREPYEYNATLGHFANSAPDRANVWHAMIDHPRFGAIRCLIALKDLKSGAELFVDDTEAFEETGYGKGGSSGTGEEDPLMNIISGKFLPIIPVLGVLHPDRHCERAYLYSKQMSLK